MQLDDEQVLPIRCLACGERFDFPVPTDVLVECVLSDAPMMVACPHCGVPLTITPMVQVEIPYVKERDGRR